MGLRGDLAYGGMFDTVFSSMYVLSLAGTMCDGITDVTIIFFEEGHYWMFSAFLAFVVLSSFTALNMLLGIVCEVIVEVKEIEEEKRLLEDVREKILATFEALDEDGSGMISKHEFNQLTENNEVLEALALMEVNSGHLLSLADSLFENDENEGESELEFADFLKVLVHFRPGTDASVMDVAETRKTMRRAIKKTEGKLAEVYQIIDCMQTPSEHLSKLKIRLQKLPDIIRIARKRTQAAEAQVQVLREKLASRGK
jgi:Ca2+-binding EF-hand superfamily protein